MKVPLGKPYIKTDVALEAIKEVLDSRWISGGPRIGEFEEKVKEYRSNRSKAQKIFMCAAAAIIAYALVKQVF